MKACRRDYTHFVSIPVPGAAAVYAALRDSVMLDAQTAAAAGLDPSVWVSPVSLHLTVVMLKLYSGEARRLACQANSHTAAIYKLVEQQGQCSNAQRRVQQHHGRHAAGMNTSRQPQLGS